jgi:hypothetical protein
MQARVRLPNRCSDRHRAVGRHLAHLDDAIDIDEKRRSQQAHVESGYEALPAREHLRLVATFCERCKCALEGLRADVLERRRLHP